LRDFKFLNIFILALLFCANSYAHKLLYQTTSSKSATAVYLDEQTRKVVVKKYNWTDDFVSKNGGKVSVKFPSTVKSLSKIYTPFFDNYSGVSSTQESLDLNNTESRIKSKLTGLVGDNSGRFDSAKIVSDIKTKIPSYKILADKSASRKRNIVLFNKETGKLFFQSGDRRSVKVSNDISFPKDLAPYFRNSEQKEYDLSSPGKIELYKKSIERRLRKARLSNGEIAQTMKEIDRLKDSHTAKISKMKLIRSIGKNGDETKLYMNLETGEFYLQRLDDGEIEYDSFYSLTDDDSYERLRNELVKEQMYSQESFDDQFKNTFIKHCYEAPRATILDHLGNIDDILSVTTKAWDKYLENAVSSKPVVLADGSLVTKISHEGVDHNVQVQVDAFGNIKSIKFLNPAAAKKAGLFIKEIIEGNEKSFKIASLVDGEEVDHFFFDMEAQDLDSNPKKSRLAIYVKGANEADPLGKHFYDKNIFEVTFNDKGFVDSGTKIQLSKERNAQYPRKFEEGDGSSVSTFFFKNFFSTKSRREKLREEITEEALKTSKGLNKDGVVLLSNDEVQTAVVSIVEEVEKEIPRLKGNVTDITSKVYKHAYDKFAQVVVPKMIENILPGESPETYKAITDKAMIDFKKCLDAAAKKSSLDGPKECMNAFEKEAPVVIGSEILDLQLKQNGYELLKEKSNAVYQECIKEEYDTKGEDLDIIKACIFKATFASVDDGLSDIVNLTLETMSKDIDPSGKLKITIPKSVQVKSQKALRQCYKDNGYMEEKIFSDKYDIEKLKDLEVETFKQDLFTCASYVEEIVATDVTEQFISDNLETMDLEDSIKLSIKDDAMKNGLEFCLEAQKKRVDLLKKAGKYSTVKASACKSYVTLYVTDKVIDHSLKDKAGEGVWNQIKDDSPHKACFEESKKKALKELLSDKEPTQDVDAESAKCLKDSVAWVSYYLSKSELKKTFASDPMYRNVKLSNEQEDFYAKELQKCFKEKLEKEQSVTSITKNLTKIQDSCTVSMIMGDSAQEDILKPVVLGMLEDNGVSDSAIDKTIDPILDSMKERAQRRLEKEDLSLTQLVDEFKNVKGTAIYFVADTTVDGYVRDFISDEKLATTESLRIRKELFDGESGYRRIFARETDEDKLASHIQDMTKDAAIKLTSVVTESEAKKLLEAGTLKSQKEVDAITKSAPKVMKKCLDSFKEGNFNEHVTFCIGETKAIVTRDVFEDQLKGILNSDDYAKHFSEEEKQKILDEHIHPKLKDEIKKAYANDGLSEFIKEFTLKATISAAGPVVKGTIAETVYGKGVKADQVSASKVALVERVSDDSAKYLDKCLRSNLEKNLTSSEDTTSCINGVRLKATGLIFEDILANVTEYFDSDEARTKELLAGQNAKLEKCVNRNKVQLDGEKYSNRLNSCLVENIFDFVEQSVLGLSNNSNFIDKLSDSDLNKFRSCISDNKRDFVKEIDSKSVRTSLYPLVDKGVDLWEKIFSSGAKDSKQVIDWTVDTVKKCSVSDLVPTAIDHLMSSSKTKSELGLNNSEYKFALQITDRIKGFAQKEFKEDFNISFKSNPKTSSSSSSSSSSTKSSSSSSSVEQKQRTDAVEHIEKIVPLLGQYIKKLNSFDSKRALTDLDKLLADIAKKKAKGEINLDDLKKSLLESDLIDTIITSEISSIIEKEAATALASYGLSAAEIKALVSPKILNPLFSKTNPKAKAIFDKIKAQFIGPLLDGKKVSGIPESIVKEVKVHLSSDTKMGGFVETLAGSIVQKSLDAQKPRNIASQSIAGLIGYNQSDFSWSNLRSRREAGVSASNQPVQKAINYFGKSILKPILLKQNLGNHVEAGIFSTTTTPVIDIRKEKFEEMVKGLMEL
jgi:hypothetical protein